MNATKSDVFTACPKCQSQNFGHGLDHADGTDCENFWLTFKSRLARTEGSGWYGCRKYQWGQYGGSGELRLIALSCLDCNHVEPIDPEFDPAN